MAERTHYSGYTVPIIKRPTAKRGGIHLRSRFVPAVSLQKVNEQRLRKQKLLKEATKAMKNGGTGLQDNIREVDLMHRETLLPAEDPEEPTVQIFSEIMDEVKSQSNFPWCYEQMRTKFVFKKIINTYQYRIKQEDRMYLQDLADWIRLSFQHYGRPAKIQVLMSYVLINRITDESRYFYVSFFFVAIFANCAISFRRVKIQ